MTHDQFDRSSALRLIVAAFSDLADLARKEVRLAFAEMAERATATVRATIWMAVAALLGFIALLVAVEGIVLLIASFGLALRWSCFVVAAALAVIAAGLALYAHGRSGLTPARSVAQLRKDIRMAKEQAR